MKTTFSFNNFMKRMSVRITKLEELEKEVRYMIDNLSPQTVTHGFSEEYYEIHKIYINKIQEILKEIEA